MKSRFLWVKIGLEGGGALNQEKHEIFPTKLQNYENILSMIYLCFSFL